MLLKANKYRKDKKADCRQNGLGSRIFVGKVFGNYAEYLHLYPSFSYGRIIAGYHDASLATRTKMQKKYKTGGHSKWSPVFYEIWQISSLISVKRSLHFLLHEIQ